jgi:hypothetical protein
MSTCRGQQRDALKKGAKVVDMGPIGRDMPNGTFGKVEDFE